MTTTSAAPGRTTTNNAGRMVTTVWDTTLVHEDGSKTQFVLETRHKKNHKVLATEVHIRVATPDGFFRREFTLFGPTTAMGGVNIANLPVARWNLRQAMAEHDVALRTLATVIAGLATDSDAGVELATVWAARV